MMPPGVGYYAGAPNAFAGGMEYSAATRRRRLQENALNALINRFGPEAAMPEEQSILQATQQRTQLQPHVVGAAERATAGAEANVAEFGPQAGDPEANAIQTREQEIRRSVLHRAVTALRMVRDREGDVRSALPQFGQILTRIGMPPNELQDLEQQIITDPDSLDELETMLRGTGAEGTRAVGAPVPVYDDQGRPRLMQYFTDGTTRIIEDVSPAAIVQGEIRLEQGAERIRAGWQRLTLDQAKARGFNAPEGHQIWETPDGRIVADPIPGTAQDRERAANMQERVEQLRDAEEVLIGSIGQSERVLRWGNRALTRMDDIWFQGHNPLSGQARRTLANRPGTATYEVAADMDQMKGVIAIDELLRIKRSGGTLGQVTERELELLKNKLSALNIERDPAPLREDLQEVLELYADLVQKSAGEIERVRELRATVEQQGRFGPDIPDTPGGPGVSDTAPAGRGPPPGPDATPEEILRYYSGGG